MATQPLFTFGPSLVDAGDVKAWAGGDQADPLLELAVSLASTVVRAYCTRGIPNPVPAEVSAVTMQLAVRLVRNPTGMRSIAVEGQSVALPPVGFTFLESLLLARYRRRSA